MIHEQGLVVNEMPIAASTRISIRSVFEKWWQEWWQESQFWIEDLIYVIDFYVFFKFTPQTDPEYRVILYRVQR
jgi:hypothetical protein